MTYDLFLFDLDDTLLDFQASERRSFVLAMEGLGVSAGLEALYTQYQTENRALWTAFEQGKTTKEHLKVQRFRTIFEANNIAIDPELASHRYLETLPQTVVLMDDAEEVCEHLSAFGEIGIITNGIHQVQIQRIKNSAIAPYISFISVSDMCGFAKPDVRFFEYSAKMAKRFSKANTLVVGDRLEADIEGAHHFGVDSCWFNPAKVKRTGQYVPRYEVNHLSEIKRLIPA